MTTIVPPRSPVNHRPAIQQPRIVQMTPAWAEELLRANTDNRNLRRKSVVAQYAGAMCRGEWVLSNDAITVREDGVLGNGQHRLHAVVQSGITISVILIEGLPVSTQDVIDTGAKRTAADLLSRRGEPHASVLAAVLRQLWIYRTTGEFGHHTAVQATHSQLLEILEREPAIREAALESERIRKGGVPIPGSITGALYHVFSSVDPEEAQVFWERFRTGANLAETDAIFALRRQLIASKAGQTKHMNTRWAAALTIIAFNYWREGHRVKLLKWNPGGANPQAFPEIRKPDGIGI
jgi:hypothetical protein